MTKIINLAEYSKSKHKSSRVPEPDDMVDRQVRKLTNNIYELLNNESFNTDDPAMMQHLLFLRRCLLAMINHQYGIADSVAELMLQSDPYKI